MNGLRFIIFILISAILLGCGGNAAGPRSTAFEPTKQANTAEVADAPEYAEIGPIELQARIMNFADSYNSRIAEAAAVIEKIGTPQARITAARMRVFDISSNITIAAGPYPGLALLDMLVLTSLRRIVWEEFWVPRLGEQAAPALNHFRMAEQEVWKASALVLTRDQLDEIASVILKWRKANPDRVGVNYIRFNNFGKLGLKPSVQRLTEPGGLFDSVKQASQAAKEMKIAIDRAFYLMSRMQLVLTYQIKLAYLEMMFEPEAEGIVNTTKEITGISARYAEIAEKMPRELREETTILMREMFAGLSQNSNDTITHALTGMSEWQKETITDIMKNVSSERQAAIDQAIDGITVQQQEIYKHIDDLVDRSGSELKETMNYAFLLGVAFIVVFFIALSLYKIFVARPADRK